MSATATKKMPSHQWYHLPDHEVSRHLDSNLETGLHPRSVVKRQEHFGPNELKSKPGKSPWVRFLLQFNQTLLYILLIAGAVKALLGEWVNAWVIWAGTRCQPICGLLMCVTCKSMSQPLQASRLQLKKTLNRSIQTYSWQSEPTWLTLAAS